MSSEVPEGWRSAQLAEIATIKTGKTPSTRQQELWGGRIPFVTPSDLSDSVWAGRVERHLTDDGARQSTVAPAGSILFTCIASIGKACVLAEASAFNQQINACLPGPDMDADFLFAALKLRTPHLKDMAGTTAVPIINKTTFGRTKIAFPPFEEQQRIAAVLRSVDDAIRAALATVTHAEKVHTGLLDTFMDAVPHGDDAQWREVKLGELVADPITYGVVQPGDYLDEGVILVRGGDFPNGQISVEGLPRISPVVARPYERSTLKGGEILVSLVGYPGACALVPMTLSGANISRSVALVRPGKNVDSDFLYHFIRSPFGQRRILLNSIGSAQQVVNLKDLREVAVPLPPHERQKEIASVMNGSMRNVLLATQYLKGLKSLKISIASDLLSGRVRVPA